MAQWAKRILATMRHQHCDCLLEVRPYGADESIAPTRIVAHRAILARAAYFGALFRHVEPDRVDRRDADGARICRSAYLLEMPFDPAALVFVVDCLYDDDHVDRAAECADPVDVIHAALFVEAPRHHVRRLVRLVLHTLLAAIATHARCGGDGRDARGQLASFVWHMLASGLEPTVKTCLLGRTLGLLTDTERAAIIDKHVDLVPAHFYQPPSRVGEAVVDDGGHRWRTIHLPLTTLHLWAARSASRGTAWSFPALWDRRPMEAASTCLSTLRHTQRPRAWRRAPSLSRSRMPMTRWIRSRSVPFVRCRAGPRHLVASKRPGMQPAVAPCGMAQRSCSTG
ncbi:BTB/POZ domain motif-containing protein [Pandoravirus inopinatum]|uniref:BTB/POZ domain motif-containing protein n=1 Tax=Pandoravirus inopinatum TaxID=1605721 RepID=A0A0B5J791_9VIRU|nr:BTB/POZ domain motif-containing protein [Pandoravirus inopinatum]AJF97690.1 BTB/POZ domain motif-containing protein [Pandoravirus inopinatum]